MVVLEIGLDLLFRLLRYSPCDDDDDDDDDEPRPVRNRIITYHTSPNCDEIQKSITQSTNQNTFTFYVTSGKGLTPLVSV